MRTKVKLRDLVALVPMTIGFGFLWLGVKIGGKFTGENLIAQLKRSSLNQ